VDHAVTAVAASASAEQGFSNTTILNGQAYAHTASGLGVLFNSVISEAIINWAGTLAGQLTGTPYTPPATQYMQFAQAGGNGVTAFGSDSDEQQTVVNLADSAALMAELQRIMQLVASSEAATPIDDGAGPCGTFMNELTYQLRRADFSDKFTHVKWTREYYHVIPAGWLVDYHQVLHVEFVTKDGKRHEFYIDAGTHLNGNWTGNLGGSDNIFFGPLPSNMVPTTGNAFPSAEEFQSLTDAYNRQWWRDWADGMAYGQVN
jgi:hypothetical protein